MTSKVTNSGPFGTAQRGTVNHILNALNHFGVPLGVSQGVQVGKENITLNDQVVAKYRYFNGIDQPLFFVFDNQYMRHPVVVDPETGVSKMVFRLNMLMHEVAGDSGLTKAVPHLVVLQSDTTEELRKFIRQMWSKVGELGDVVHTLSENSSAIFNGIVMDQGGIDIEFWNSNGAQQFVDYINENYSVQSGLKQQQVFSVWTYAHRIASHAKYSNYFSKVKDKDKNTVVADFDNFVDANELFTAVQALGVQTFRNFTA